MRSKQEIERKFILTGLPDLQPREQHVVRQAYLYADDNLEIRLTIRYDADTYDTMLPRVNRCKLTIKFGNGLVRTEAEIKLTEDQMNELCRFVEGDFITKRFNIYNLPDTVTHSGLEFHASIVDPGAPNSFMYGEIEFASEKAADSYRVPKVIDAVVRAEVTGQDTWQMKNYWRRTRKGEPV